MTYLVRPATVDDIDILVHHRIAMFTDMGLTFDAAELASTFGDWVRRELATGSYRAWLAEHETTIIGGAGATIIPWPPGPRYPGTRLAFVYNVYTEPEHRRRGVARLLMETIHDWCRDHDVDSVALNASSDGQLLYEAMGYALTPSPMMFFSLLKV